jgi:hypothetical protein
MLRDATHDGAEHDREELEKKEDDMRVKMTLRGLMVAGFAIALTVQAWAYPEVARQTKAACAACHISPAGGAALTDAGKAFKTEKKALDTKVAGAEYVGPNKCRMCHLKEYKAWGDTPHARAFAMLKAAPDSTVAKVAKMLGVELKGPAAQSDACVGCHVTGFKLPGGYPAADSTKNVSLMAVSCESCHGPGGKHVPATMADKKKMINRAVTANMCTQCHTPALSPKFNFVEFKKKGVHPIPVAKTTG